MGFNWAFEGLNRLGREAGGSTSSNAEEKNEWIHKSAPLASFLAVGSGKIALRCLTLQRGVTGTAHMLHTLTHSSISRQVRERM